MHGSRPTYEKHREQINHFATGGGDLVHPVYLVFLVINKAIVDRCTTEEWTNLTWESILSGFLCPSIPITAMLESVQLIPRYQWPSSPFELVR